MLTLIFGALALWLWIPGRPDGINNAKQWWKIWQKSGRSALQENRALSEDARVIRELSALLRSGLGFYPAVEVLFEAEDDSGNIAQALKQLQATHRLHNQNGNELGNLNQSQEPAVQRMYWCLQISQRSGASLADVLERLADDLESALVAQQSFDAAMAGPKATTKLLTWLPLVGFSFGLLVGIDVIGAIISSWAAQLSVAIGIILWVANRWWCQRLMLATSAQAMS